jgi:hypothetical protein
MKVICECGKEGSISCPPSFGETSAFAMGHGHVPSIVRCVCVCGAEMKTGPGVYPNAFVGGMMAGAWFTEHAPHMAS